MKVRKILAWVMVFTFLNLVISPDLTFARSYKPGYIEWEDDSPTWSDVALWGGVVLVLGIVLYVVIKSKSKASAESHKSAESQNDNNQLAQTQMDNVKYTTDNKLITPSGNLILVRW